MRYTLVLHWLWGGKHYVCAGSIPAQCTGIRVGQVSHRKTLTMARVRPFQMGVCQGLPIGSGNAGSNPATESTQPKKERENKSWTSLSSFFIGLFAGLVGTTWLMLTRQVASSVCPTCIHIPGTSASGVATKKTKGAISANRKGRVLVSTSGEENKQNGRSDKTAASTAHHAIIPNLPFQSFLLFP